MAVGNGSGRDVEYEVQPSNPGGDLTQPLTIAMLATVAGGAFTAYGCLVEGGTTLTVVGLFLLAAALVANAVALNRTKKGSALATGPKKHLPSGEQHDSSFIAGTWVVFYEVGQNTPIAQSPIILDDLDCIVVLRQCPALANEALMADAKTFVEVIPSGP